MINHSKPKYQSFCITGWQAVVCTVVLETILAESLCYRVDNGQLQVITHDSKPKCQSFCITDQSSLLALLSCSLYLLCSFFLTLLLVILSPCLFVSISSAGLSSHFSLLSSCPLTFHFQSSLLPSLTFAGFFSLLLVVLSAFTIQSFLLLLPPPPPPPSFSLSLSLECFFPHSCSSSFHPPFFSVRKWSSLMALIPSSNNLVVLFGVGPPHSVVTWESGTLPYSSAN